MRVKTQVCVRLLCHQQNPEFFDRFKIYPGLGYVDFSRRKILFDFGSFRRGSDISIRNGNSYQHVGIESLESYNKCITCK